MTRQVASLILCGCIVIGSGCATKSFVEKRVGATEAKLTQQASAWETKLSQQTSATESKLTAQASTIETKLAQQANAMDTKLSQQASETQTKLRETADRVGASQQAIDAANQQLKGLDTRMDEVGALTTDARTQANATHAANVQLSQRLAGRNNYRLLETRYLYFEPDQAEIRKQDIHELEGVAKALKADGNAVLELQGFADPRGSDRYNYQLARDRVEAATRYLVQRHDIELRQVRAISMGKVVLGPSEKPSPEVLAKARRVDIRLLAPWSSWEDAAQTRMGHAAPARADTVALPVPRESTQPTPTSIEPDQPATPKNIPARSSPNGAELKNGAPGTALIEIILKDMSPQDLGGTSSQH
jgi:outer membrane protein OmpA-like peptidoglycan-associated protein